MHDCLYERYMGIDSKHVVRQWNLGDIWETVSGNDLVLLLISDAAQVCFASMVLNLTLCLFCFDNCLVLPEVTLLSLSSLAQPIYM
jgi:hypothetical protein